MPTLNNATVGEIRDLSNWETIKRGSRTIIQFQGEDAFERKNSLIPDAGMGLFALQPLRKKKTFNAYVGKVVGPFTNEFLKSKKYMRLRCRDPEGDYMMAIDGNVVDGYGGKTGAQFINDTRGGPGRNMTAKQRKAAGLWAGRRPAYNARIGSDGRGSIMTKETAIEVGSEIYMDYGTTYWTRFNRETDCVEFAVERAAREAVERASKKKKTKEVKVTGGRTAGGRRWRYSKRLRDSRGRRIRIYEK